MSGSEFWRPLAGIKVLALEGYVAGPIGTMLLADWGAEVVKIEKPGGDPYRHMPPFMSGENGQVSLGFARVNRNKKSVCLDLTTQEDRCEFFALVDTADVVIQNLRPGSVQRLGVDYWKVRERNPSIVYISISGFGSGPEQNAFGDLPAYDLIAQAMSGLGYVAGDEEDPPVAIPAPIVDTATGYWAVISALLGLHQRAQSGEGSHFDLSMVDVGMHLNEYFLGFSSNAPTSPPRGRLATAAPVGYYRANDGWFALSVTDEGTWSRFCDVIGFESPDSGLDLSSGEARAKVSESKLRSLIELWSHELPTETVVEVLLRSGVPACRVERIEDVRTSGYASTRESAWITVSDPAWGSLDLVNNPVRMEAGLPVVSAPQLGEHDVTVSGLARVQE